MDPDIDSELLESIRTLNKAIEQAERGEGRPMREFLESLARDHGISLKSQSGPDKA